jgi:hypothetical protein
MKLRSSLSLKVLVLLALPAILQFALLFWLFNLSVEAERALDKARHANEVANALIHLRVNMYKVITLAGGEKSDYAGNEDVARSYGGTKWPGL